MTRSRKFTILHFAIGLTLATTSAAFAESTTQPATTQPATTQPAVAVAATTTQPAVALLLSDIDAAYAKLASAQFDGQITAHFNIHGQVQAHDVSFTSSFSAPNKFRHQSTNDSLVGSTGTTAYSVLAKRDQYQSSDAPKTRAASSEWPAAVIKILSDQNPSLLLATVKSAAVELTGISKDITLERPTVIAGVSYPTIRFDGAGDHPIVTMLVDPSTHLLRRVTFDYCKPMEKAGATGVKQAEVAIDYTKAIANAPIDPDQFAWTPPTGAPVTTTTVAMVQADDSEQAVKDLVGKAAPDFSLKKLDDTSVKLSDLKGSVVILDFWATWCGPCVASLPHLDKLNADESPNGLKVLAVNLREDMETVQAFVDKKKWTLPVALDTDGAVAQQYKANAIPETVVIGKDGIVKQIFVGSGNEDAIKALVTKEMK